MSSVSLCTVNVITRLECCENNLHVSLWTDDHSSSTGHGVLFSREDMSLVVGRGENQEYFSFSH